MHASRITIPNGSLATRELGQFKMNAWIDGMAKAIRAVKTDQKSLRLQNECFFEKAIHLLETRP
jgi:creatinine amidohydrolase